MAASATASTRGHKLKRMEMTCARFSSHLPDTAAFTKALDKSCNIIEAQQHNEKRILTKFRL
jgi:hypothetical protein